MSKSVQPIPAGHEGLIPHLVCSPCSDAIEFYKKAFGATEIMRLGGPDGRIGHAELKIAKAKIMLADEFPDIGARGPKSIGGSPVTIHVYVEDVDATVALAVKAGATIMRPVENKFYGDRGGEILDPYGHRWSIASHIEDLSPEEMELRMGEMPG